MNESSLLQCYNRGCGQKYDPSCNNENSCCHHPGEPFFHDAYKGWSCCNKKCTDFTEFLNIKGCTLSPHSNIKPPEPEKLKPKELVEVIEVKPIVPTKLPRPPFDTSLTTLIPEIAPSLNQVMSKKKSIENVNPNEIAIGTSCKNGGCKVTYQGPETNDTVCIYHSGYPVFHEGLKYWSCCTKRTTDFQAFLDQVGCQEGNHLWQNNDGGKEVNCRWDYHQTGTHVIVAIYAKEYDLKESIIKINPIRLYSNLVFPQQNANFSLDLELQGVIDVEKSKVTMYGTKVEISLKKAEPGSWSNLEINKKIKENLQQNKEIEQDINNKIDAVDLNDL